MCLCISINLYQNTSSVIDCCPHCENVFVFDLTYELACKYSLTNKSLGKLCNNLSIYTFVFLLKLFFQFSSLSCNSMYLI